MEQKLVTIIAAELVAARQRMTGRTPDSRDARHRVVRRLDWPGGGLHNIFSREDQCCCSTVNPGGSSHAKKFAEMDRE